MIEELHIAGLGVIEEATLDLSSGLTVVTGETGAGKTMVVTALELLLGARADSTLVRGGAGLARVEARLRPVPQTAAAWLEDGEDELVVSREILAEGRSRVRLNGRLATVSALADGLGGVVEVHAQHAHVTLAQPRAQRRLLDRFAGEPHARVLARYREAHGAWRAATAALARLHDDARERAREADRLAHEADEIDAANLDPDADARIDDRLAVLEHVEELQHAAAEAGDALGPDAAGEPLGLAVQALRRVRVDDSQLEGLRERAEGLAAEAAELAADVRAYGEGLEADPGALQALRERRQMLLTLGRKYGDSVESILAYGAEARDRLAALDQQAAESGELTEQVSGLAAALHDLAQELHRGRRTAAGVLCGAVEANLADLGLPHATFRVEVEADDSAGDGDGHFGPEGQDRVAFLLSANPGEPARPLGQAASGGERSRVALAVEAALADAHDAAVLVFDEVDAGIGGATAMAVGEKLARLARGRQVLCVTHLAQLAAFADVHHVVEKGIVGGKAVTTARLVTAGDRVAELSRMLSGDPDRAEAAEHARVLLEEAAGRRAG